MIYVLVSALFFLANAPVVYALTAPPRRLGRRRGTPGQLALQEMRRAERLAAYNLQLVREWAPEHGVRADWVMQ